MENCMRYNLSNLKKNKKIKAYLATDLSKNFRLRATQQLIFCGLIDHRADLFTRTTHTRMPFNINIRTR